MLTPRQRWFLFFLFLGALSFQYCYKLDGTGVLDPDEPRYASIGRSMALDGDWITPHLWGSPWFEKPALLYWMTALGTCLHLDQDIAGRLPVALLSLGFLVTWYFLFGREMGDAAAAISTLLIGTSAGWIVYSTLCLTDLPMSAFFSLALLLALRLMRGEHHHWVLWFALGACLGLAALAKGLVPIVLAAPLAWFLRRHWRKAWLPVLGILLTAGPWYALVWMRNGFAFIQVFFLQQQFSRMYSGSLQHVKPVYFYVPVLLGALFPWTPALVLLRPRLWRTDARLLCLASVVLFGFLFFSASLNKLSGYILPLLPALCGLIGISAAKSAAYQRRSLLIACAALIALIPFLGQLIPTLMTRRLSWSPDILIAMLPITLGMVVLFVTPLAVGILANKAASALLLVLCCSLAIVQLKLSIFPVLDEQVSPRGVWREIQNESDQVCDAGLHRSWQYGLAFYHGRPFPSCDQMPRPIHLVQQGSQRATIINEDK